MTTERIDIQITETGARRVKGSIEGIGTAAEGSERQLKLLKQALGALGVAAIVRSLLKTADAYTTMMNQVKLVTTSTGQMKLVMDEVLQIANRTRASFEGTAEAYTKVARTSKSLGASQSEVLGFTESLNQAIAISGSTSAQAEAGIRQLGQAMGRGVLIGDEFVSIMENTNEVAQVIARGMGVPIGALKKLSSEGKITAKIIFEAFQKAREELGEKFAKTVPTFGQALTVLGNQWTDLIGKFDQANGVTRGLAKGILFVSDNLEIITRVVAALAIVIMVQLARQAIGYLISQLAVLTAWAAANPFTALLGLVVAVTAALVVFADKITVSKDGFITLADVGVAAFRLLKKGVAFLANQYQLAWEFILQTGYALFGDLVDVSMSFPRAIVKGLDFVLVRFLSFSAGIVNLWRQAMENLKGPTGVALSDAFTQGFQDSMNRLTEGGGKGPLERGIDQLMLEAGLVSQERREKEFFAEQDRLKAAKDMDVKTTPEPTPAGKFKKTFGSELQQLKNEGLLLLKNTLARELQNNVIKMEETLKRSLTQRELELLATVSLNNIALKNRSDALEQLGGPMEEFFQKTNSLNAIMRDTPQLTAAVTEELAKLELQMLSSQANTGGGPGAMVDGYIRQLRIMQLETRNAVGDMGASFAQLFGPGGQLVQGIGDAVAQSVIFGERFDQAIKKVAQSVVANLISSLVQLGLNMLLNAALGNSLAVAAAATSTATAAAVTAAWGPAATLVNAATFGAGAAAGTGALATSLATVKGLAAVAGFAEGGYTGGAGRGSVAGVVHGQEYVLNAGATRRLGRGNLDRLNSGAGGFGSQMNVTVVNRDIPGIEFQTRQLSDHDVEVIAQRVVHRDAPGVIASDLANPAGRTSRSLGANTTSSRKRG